MYCWVFQWLWKTTFVMIQGIVGAFFIWSYNSNKVLFTILILYKFNKSTSGLNTLERNQNSKLKKFYKVNYTILIFN